MSARPQCHSCHGTGRIVRLVGMEYPDEQWLPCPCDPTPKEQDRAE